jgi:hypothetical protein
MTGEERKNAIENRVTLLGAAVFNRRKEFLYRICHK